MINRTSIRALIVLALLGAIAVAPGCRRSEAAGDSDDAAKAIEAAKTWLAIVDEGDYGRAYDESAAMMRGAISRDQLITSFKGVRGPLGAVGERKVGGATPATSLPGAPDGRYVVIQFKTSFANKKSAIETVTPMLEKDGKWRVSGYYIK